MPTFTCFRCKNYTTKTKYSIYLHLCKNIRCTPHIDSLKYNDDEQIKYSISPVENWNLLKINKNFKIIKTHKEFIDELKDIYNTKRKKCNYCNLECDKYKELENHLLECIKIYNNNDNDNLNNINNISNINNIDNINNSINISNNINNINNTNNTNNTNNINFNINITENKQEIIKIIPFNKNWNVEHINLEKKLILFLSQFTPLKI
jgi:hypothetical protein